MYINFLCVCVLYGHQGQSSCLAKVFGHSIPKWHVAHLCLCLSVCNHLFGLRVCVLWTMSVIHPVLSMHLSLVKCARAPMFARVM